MAAFGIAFTRRTVHAGQGTANTCASFEGTFLELLWPRDATELRTPAVRPLGLDERIRWRETGACPFGLAFRPDVSDSDAASWPFPTWRYEAPYFPPGVALPIVTPADRLDEPLVFVMRRSKPGTPGGLTAGGTSPSHRGAPRTITRLVVQSPAAGATNVAGLAMVRRTGSVRDEERARPAARDRLGRGPAMDSPTGSRTRRRCCCAGELRQMISVGDECRIKRGRRVSHGCGALPRTVGAHLSQIAGRFKLLRSESGDRLRR